MRERSPSRHDLSGRAGTVSTARARGGGAAGGAAGLDSASRPVLYCPRSLGLLRERPQRGAIVKSITADQAKTELSRLVRHSVKGHETFQLLTIAVAPDAAPTVPTTATHRGTGS